MKGSGDIAGPTREGKEASLSEDLDAAYGDWMEGGGISLSVAITVCSQLAVPLLHLRCPPPPPPAEPALSSFLSTEVPGLIMG